MDETIVYCKDDIETSHFTNDDELKIHQLTLDIYSEFESILKICGEKPLSSLVPLVANLLESLNSLSVQKDKFTVELDMLKDHHTILLSKYETGKNDAKRMEEKLFSVEDDLQEKKRKIEALETASASSKRLMELKIKNAHDHIYRLEEREADLRTTYTNLRARYGELFRAYLDFMEKSKVTSSSPTTSVGYPKIEEMTSPNVLEEFSNACSSTTGMGFLPISHKGDSPYDWGSRRQVMQAIHDSIPELVLDADGSPFSKLSDDKFDESFAPEDKTDENEGSVNTIPDRQESFDFNVSREVNKLVKENNELEETKNALNVVIHDLITQIETVNFERDQMRETLNQFQTARLSMQLHISGLEQEVVRLKKELASYIEAQQQDDAQIGTTPFSKRNRFTREEMSKVLLERNQYKEDLYELRETLRWGEVLKARSQRASSSRDSSSWQAPEDGNRFLSFFSRLFRRRGSVGNLNNSVAFERSKSLVSRSSELRVRFKESTSVVTESMPRIIMASPVDLASTQTRVGGDGTIPNPLSGWIPIPITGKPCLPQPIVLQAKTSTPLPPPNAAVYKPQSPPLPLLLYRRPIPEAISGRMTVSCATCIYQDVGGLLPSGEVLAGSSTFFQPRNFPVNGQAGGFSYSELAESWTKSINKMSLTSTRLSHEIWMCLTGISSAVVATSPAGDSLDSSKPMTVSSQEAQPVFRSQIVVVDTDNPSRYVDSFSLARSIVTCMAAVPGASKRDYDVLRYANAVWDSIAFASSAHYPVPSVAAEDQPDPDPESAAASSPRPPSPEPLADTSTQICNTLSSLKYYTNPDGRHSQGNDETTSLRLNAFQPVQMSVQCGQRGADPNHDFYRIERQRFVQRTVSTAGGSTFESVDLDESSHQPVISNTVQQTVWLGCQNGDIFIHSNMGARKRCLQTTRLPSGVTAICNFSGRVFVSLADGHVVVFRRLSVPTRSVSQPPSADQNSSPMTNSLLSERGHEAEAVGAERLGPLGLGFSQSVSQDLAITTTTPQSPAPNCSGLPSNELSIGQELAAVKLTESGGSWDLSETVVITCGPPDTYIKCMTIVPPVLTIWVACGSDVLVIDTTSFQKLSKFKVSSKTGSPVKCMSWIRDGVWISLRTEPIVRLYNAFTNMPLQELDVQSCILDTIGSSLVSARSPTAFAVTILSTSPNHLWMGSKCGAVLVAPFCPGEGGKEAALGASEKSPLKGGMNDANDDSGDAQAPSTPVRRASPFEEPVHSSAPSTTGLGFGDSSAMIDMSGVSVSMYGHSEAVNFFTLVSGSGPNFPDSSPKLPSSTPQSASSENYFMLSGGVGFVDYRDTTNENELSSEQIVEAKRARSYSHLLVWSLSTSNPSSS